MPLYLWLYTARLSILIEYFKAFRDFVEFDFYLFKKCIMRFLNISPIPNAQPSPFYLK